MQPLAVFALNGKILYLSANSAVTLAMASGSIVFRSATLTAGTLKKELRKESISCSFTKPSSMMFEPIRTPKITYDRHLDYFVNLAETAEPKLRGSEQLEWFNRLELELENLRGALMYAFEGSDAVDQGHNIEAAAGMVGALWLFWFIRERFSEGRHWAEKVLASMERNERNGEVFGKVLNTDASFCYFQGDYSLAQELSQRGLVVCKASNDLFGESISRHHLGLIANVRGDAVLAGKELNQGLQLAIRLDDAWLISLLQNDISWLAYSEGNQTSRLAVAKEIAANSP